MAYFSQELAQKSPKSPNTDEINNNSIELDEEFSDPEEGEIFSSDEDPDVPISIAKPPVRSPCSKQASKIEFF